MLPGGCSNAVTHASGWCINLCPVKTSNPARRSCWLLDVKGKRNLNDLSLQTKTRKIFSEKSHCLETLLTARSYEDLDRVCNKRTVVLLQGTNDAFEDGRYVGEVSDTATNEAEV